MPRNLTSFPPGATGRPSTPKPSEREAAGRGFGRGTVVADGFPRQVEGAISFRRIQPH